MKILFVLLNNVFIIQLPKPALDNVLIPDENSKMKLAEEVFYEKNWTNTGERIRKLLFPVYVENYEKYRQKITSGELIICEKKLLFCILIVLILILTPVLFFAYSRV